jgi:hypothetical protein
MPVSPTLTPKENRSDAQRTGALNYELSICARRVLGLGQIANRENRSASVVLQIFLRAVYSHQRAILFRFLGQIELASTPRT